MSDKKVGGLETGTRPSRWMLPVVAASLGLFLAGSRPAFAGDAAENMIYVCPTGSDDNPGTADEPVKTPEKAKALVRSGMAVYFLPPRTHVFVSPAGDDTNDGTKDKPFRSVAKAVGGAGPGTIIHLLPGVYPPFQLTGLSGAPHNPIVIRGEAVLPLDFSAPSQLADNGSNRELNIQPIRKALREGKFSVGVAGGVAVVEGQGKGVGVAIKDCSHMILENLVIRNGGTNLGVSGQDITIRGCAVHSGGNGVSVGGGRIRLQRVVAYGQRGGGFDLGVPGDGQVELVECVAYDNGRRGRESASSEVQGDGFSCGSKKIGSIHLLRCLSLNNWSDGFDFKPGKGAVFEFCISDGNGDMGVGFKDLKIWTGGSLIIRSRATGKILFVSGTHELRDFKNGVRDPEPKE